MRTEITSTAQSFIAETSSARSSIRPLLASGAAFAMAIAAGSLSASANDGITTTPFGKSGHWSIVAVSDARGFNHCAARVAYKSGIKVGMLGYFNGNWTLQFYRDDWAQRAEELFDVTLEVDGRQVLAAKGKWSGKSAFIYLGNSNERLAALMNGNEMTIVTASGRTKFRLDGSAKAVGIANSCRQAQMAANPRREQNQSANNGAFGAPAPSAAPARGAFGAPAAKPAPAPTPTPAQPIKLTRAETLPYADRYLKSRGISAQPIPEDANVLKHFPVNWKTQSGVIGGAMAIRGTAATAAQMADQLMAEQKQLCAGTLANAARYKTVAPDGSQIELATARCEGGTSNYSIVFQVTSPAAGTMLIITEMVTAAPKPMASLASPAADEL